VVGAESLNVSEGGRVTSSPRRPEVFPAAPDNDVTQLNGGTSYRGLTDADTLLGASGGMITTAAAGELLGYYSLFNVT